MSSVFTSVINCSVTPLETVLLSDGQDTATLIDSNIDQTLGSSFTMPASYDGNLYAKRLLTGMDTPLSDIFPSAAANVTLLFLKVHEKEGAGYVDLEISGSTTGIRLVNAGDFMVLPLQGLSTFSAFNLHTNAPHMVLEIFANTGQLA